MIKVTEIYFDNLQEIETLEANKKTLIAFLER